MKCFYHPTSDAIGICKFCGKGVCVECAVEVDRSLACRGRCEDDVGSINDLQRRARFAYGKAAGAYTRQGIILLLMGACFSGYSAYTQTGPGLNAFLYPLGAILFVASAFSFWSARKYRSDKS